MRSVYECVNENITINSEACSDFDKLPFIDGFDTTPDGDWSVNRVFSKYDGLYIHGNVNDYDIICTLDTGCSRSLLSFQAYESIPECSRPALTPVPKQQLSGADGTEIASLGSAQFTVKLGEAIFTHSLFIANIQDECLIGSDILLHEEAGPMDILLSHNMIMLKNCKIPLIVQNKRQTRAARKVSVLGFPELKPNSITVVKVFVDRSADEIRRAKPRASFEVWSFDALWCH